MSENSDSRPGANEGDAQRGGDDPRADSTVSSPRTGRC